MTNPLSPRASSAVLASAPATVPALVVASDGSVCPPKPNPFRKWALFWTVLSAIGTAFTIIGGGILMSFHKLTVDDEDKRRAWGITLCVVGAVMIPPALVLSVQDGIKLHRWWKWNQAHPRAAGVTAQVVPAGTGAGASAPAAATEPVVVVVEDMTMPMTAPAMQPSSSSDSAAALELVGAQQQQQPGDESQQLHYRDADHDHDHDHDAHAAAPPAASSGATSPYSPVPAVELVTY